MENYYVWVSENKYFAVTENDRLSDVKYLGSAEGKIVCSYCLLMFPNNKYSLNDECPNCGYRL